MIVRVDRLPFEAEIFEGALVRLVPTFGAADIRQDDGWARRVSGLARDRAVAGDVLRGFRPFVLHDHQYAEAELRHDLGRVRADRRGIEPPLGMRHRPRPDRGARDLEEPPFMLEAVVRQGLDDDLRRFDKAWPRLVHRDAEALVFDARRAASEAKHATSAAQDVEQCDFFGDPHRIMPGQHDDRGAEADAAGAASEIGEQLRRRRRHRVAGEVVFEREQRVEAQGLGEIADRQMLADDGCVRAPGLAQHVERGPDLHGNPPGPSLPACSADRAVPSTKPRESPKAAGRLRPLSRAGRACTFGPSAGVAEWQTRQTQNLLPVREWGFKSLHPHQTNQ